MYTDSLTSPTTASGSTPVDIPPSTAEAVEDNSNLPDSPTESQLAPNMSCLGGSTPHDQTTDKASSQQHSDSEPSDNDQSTISPESPAPRRSARSTKGIPPVCFGKIYINSSYFRSSQTNKIQKNPVCPLLSDRVGVKHCCHVMP